MGRRCFNPRRSLALLLSSAGVCVALTGAPSVALAEGVDVAPDGVTSLHDAAPESPSDKADLSGATSVKDFADLVDEQVKQSQQDAAGVPGASQGTPAPEPEIEEPVEVTPGETAGDDAASSMSESSGTDEAADGEVGVSSEGDSAPAGAEEVTDEEASRFDEIVDDLTDAFVPVEDQTTSDSTTSDQPGSDSSAAGQPGASLDSEDDDEEPAGPVIEDGTYLIQSSQSSQVLDTAGDSTSSTANVQTDNATMSSTQKWQITYDKKTGYYTVGIAGTNKVLDVAGGTAAPGTNVWIYDSNHSDAQLWKIVERGGGYVLVSKLNPNLVLDLSNGGTTAGTNVQVWESNGSGAQIFHFLSTIVDVPSGDTVEEGTYFIVAGGEESGLAVGVASGSLADGANVQLTNKANSGSQHLTLVADGDGYYTIVVSSSGKALEAENGSIVPGTNVSQNTKNGSDAQKWALHRNEDGTLSLQNKASGLFLDVSGGTFLAGANVQTYTGNGTASQKFWFLPVTSAADDDGIIIEDGVYLVQTAGGLTQVLDVANGATSNFTNVQIFGSNMSAAQRWRITRYNGTQYFTIGLDGTNMVLDVAGGSSADGTNVQIYEANGSAAQLWKFVKNGASYLIVSGLRADLVLSLAGGVASNGANVEVRSANDTQGQLFNLLSFNPKVEAGVTGKDGAYVLVVGSQQGGHVVDIASGSLSNGANAQIFESNGSGAQRLYLHDDGTGFYTITVIGTGKVLDVDNGNLVPTSNVWQWEYNGTDAQKWALRANADGSFSLINKANGLALDVASGVIGNGSNLQVYTYNGSAAQKFWLAPTSILSNGIYSIGSILDTNKVVDIESGSSASGAKAQVYTSNGSLAQRFQVVYDASSDTYRIRTAASGGWLTQSGSTVTQQGSSKTAASGSDTWKAVWNGAFFSFMNELSGQVISLGGTADGDDLVMANASGSRNQHFVFISCALISEGLYEIHSGAQPGLSLDVVNGSTASGAGIQVFGDNNSVAQKFYIVVSGNGYAIKNFKSGKVVDVVNGSTANGAPVQQYDINGSPAQLWNAQIADGGGIVFVNLNSGKALNVASNNSVNQANLDVSSASQRWTLEVTQGYGWIDQDGTWYFHYGDGRSQAFTDAAKRAWDKIQTMDSKTQYLITVDNTYFRTVVFQGSAGNWEPVYDWLCAVGYDSPDRGKTYPGMHEITHKGYKMGTDYWGAEYYWSEFFNNGLTDEGQRFHSLIYINGNLAEDGRGSAVSHGCVRLWITEAKWIYDNAPIGTRVYVFD